MSAHGGVGGGGATPTSVETGVDGSPAEIRAQGRWLRRTLAGGLDDAADRQASARRAARRGWTGAAADGYDDVAGAAVRATDDHAARVRRAAVVADDLADDVAQLRRTMAGVRDRAHEGGLTVIGTTITVPAPAGAADLPLMGTHLLVEQRRALLTALAEEVADARAAYRDRLDGRLAAASQDAADRADLDRLLGRVPATGAPVPDEAGPSRAGGAGPATLAGPGAGGGVPPDVAAPGADQGPGQRPDRGPGALAGRRDPGPPGVVAGTTTAAPWAEGTRQPEPAVSGRRDLRRVVRPHAGGAGDG